MTLTVSKNNYLNISNMLLIFYLNFPVYLTNKIFKKLIISRVIKKLIKLLNFNRFVISSLIIDKSILFLVH